jgi:hypothetical protein
MMTRVVVMIQTATTTQSRRLNMLHSAIRGAQKLPIDSGQTFKHYGAHARTHTHRSFQFESQGISSKANIISCRYGEWHDILQATDTARHNTLWCLTAITHQNIWNMTATYVITRSAVRTDQACYREQSCEICAGNTYGNDIYGLAVE